MSFSFEDPDSELGKLLLYQLSYARLPVGWRLYISGFACQRWLMYSVKRRTNAPDGPEKYAVPRNVTGSWDERFPPRA